MTGGLRRRQSQRWLIRRTLVAGGRRAGSMAWVVLRYRWGQDALLGNIRVVQAVLGTFATLERAMDAARRDCAVFYDERSHP